MEEEYDSNKKKKLFSSAMKAEWEKVIEMYKEDASLHKARISPTGQTALHIAVSDGKEDLVSRMVQAMKQTQPDTEELVNALRTPNRRNNTALHLAASMGNATMCHVIARVEPTLVDDRNNDGETPLFLAALHGRKQAFLLLHSIRNPHITTPPFYVNCRRNNGDTILHSAINGDYFDLAFQIIHLYKDLANSVNEEGLSPLHLLALKPSVFRSGSRLGRMEFIIYHYCTYVEKLKAEYPLPIHQTCPSEANNSDSHDYPHNYKTLWPVCWLIIKKVFTVGCKPVVESDAGDPEARGSRVDGAQQADSSIPSNYRECGNLIKFFYFVFQMIMEKGTDVSKIYRIKKTHTWAVQIVKQILRHTLNYEYEYDGRNPQGDFSRPTTSQDVATSTELPDKIKKQLKRSVMETPILIAAKNGVLELVEQIVELFPVAIHDLTEEKKNIVLLAVEHRQPHVYRFLLKKNIYKESLFYQLDRDENSTLHLAATLGGYKPWLISGEALQMQWELKWYEFVKKSIPTDLTGRYNNNNETPDEIFTRTHIDLVKSGGEWLRRTSESCSVVATLVATVAFTAAATIPGGVKQDSGYPVLENETSFKVFAASSLVALCCSVMAVVTFLSLLTSRYQEQDFRRDLPLRSLIGLTLLLMSIASMLVSFCAGHFFILKHQLHHAAFSLYAITCLVVIFYVLSQFPLYFDYLRATFIRVPQRS